MILELRTGDGELAIAQEGRHKKFVNRIEQICYNADFARREGRTALFVTERAVFDVLDGRLQLVEIAPGVDLERDILAHMAFKPSISPELRLMDARLFRPEPMKLINDIEANRNRNASERARRASE